MQRVQVLFNAVTDAIYQLELIKANLVYVQQQAEEIVIREADSEDVYHSAGAITLLRTK